MRGFPFFVLVLMLWAHNGRAQDVAVMHADADARISAIGQKLIAWRRDIHANPELGNAEIRTSKLVAAHLKKLGLEVRTGVAGTGVVGVLKGGKPGPVVALRADMDGLPVQEQTGLPFASKASGTYRGNTVPVMHACGHDAHTAMLMATAEVLAAMRADLAGQVVFLFQPAEEGPSDFDPDGVRTWGAKLMVSQGALDSPKVDVVFGLHVFAGQPAGQISWRTGPTMASSDLLRIKISGRQTHGARPWAGIDPIVVASQVVLGLQTIASRQVEVTKEPSIITVGQIHGGVRNNIIPDAVELEGTIRTFDGEMQNDIHGRVQRTAEKIAESAGARADVSIVRQYGVTSNHTALTAQMAPTLMRVAGEGRWRANADKVTGSEDFSEFGKRVPAFFFFLGITPPDRLTTAAANHSPQFYIDESALPTGVRALTQLTLDYLMAPTTP
jgi:amidohydrolase